VDRRTRVGGRRGARHELVARGTRDRARFSTRTSSSQIRIPRLRPFPTSICCQAVS
jgi:hypothetical protein